MTLMRPWFAVFVSAAALFPAPVLAGPAESGTQYLATIASMTKMVRVQIKEGADLTPAAVGTQLPEGAQVVTLADAKCEVRFTQAHFVRLGPDSRLKIARMERKKGARVLLQLLAGRVKAMINRSLGEEADFGIYGATTVTAVKGTDYDMARDEKDIVTVLINDGRVNVAELKSDKPEELDRVFTALLLGRIGFDMRAGKMLTVTPGSLFPSPVPIPPGMKTPWGDNTPAPGAAPKKPGAPGFPGMGFGMP